MATVWPFSFFFERAVRLLHHLPLWESVGCPDGKISKSLSLHLIKKKWHHLKNKAAAHPLATLSPTKATTVKPSGLEAELQEHGVSTNTLTIPPWTSAEFSPFAFLVSLFDLRSGSMCIHIQTVTCVNANSCLQCCHSVAPLHPFVLAASASAPIAYASMHAMVNSVIID